MRLKKMADEMLWSMSTTIREAERIEGFLQTATKMEGIKWDKEGQKKFQILLIQYHQYLNDVENTQTTNKLNQAQVAALANKEVPMSYDMAKSIFDAKDYQDPPMRGRQSMKPLVKLGLCYIEKEKVCISKAGKKLAAGEISFSEYMLEALMKYQYPNPYENGFKNWNTKPFINTLRLINKVNELCKANNLKEKGLTKDEFGIFALSLKSPEAIDKTASDVIKFRTGLSKIRGDDQKKSYIDNYISQYLSDFKNPIKNVREYTDNMIRYLRLTKYICIRGSYDYACVDLEPRRKTEIDTILKDDDGHAKVFTKEKWQSYMGDYGTYQYPFETAPILKKIATELTENINSIENEISVPKTIFTIPENTEQLKLFISENREYRTTLQARSLKIAFRKNLNKIDDVINALNNIRNHEKTALQKSFSIELEKWANAALNVLNDCEKIRGNAPMGDDFEPLYTAGNGVPDIECYYKEFGAICEVTMLTSRDQWYNEGQPVMRHLRGFENANPRYTKNYCLFVAPRLHTDTVNTFWMATKYEYEGKQQKIIPITIAQLVSIVEAVKQRLVNQKTFDHYQLEELYQNCTSLDRISNSTEWTENLQTIVNNWTRKIRA